MLKELQEAPAPHSEENRLSLRSRFDDFRAELVEGVIDLNWCIHWCCWGDTQ